MKSKIHVNPLFIYGFFAICTAMSFFMDFETTDPDSYGLDWSGYISGILYKFFEQTSEWIGENGFYITVVFCAIFYLYNLFFVKKSIKKIKGDSLLAFFFSVMYVGGRSYEYGGTLKVLCNPAYNVVKAFIVLCGMYMLYLLGIRLLHELLTGKWDTSFKLSDKMIAFYNKHTFLFLWMIILISWSIHLIFRYPAALGEDDWNELGYYYGATTFTTAQPIFHTWVIGSFVEFGRVVFHSSTLGLFLCVLCRYLIMSAVLAYTIYRMKLWDTPQWLKLLSLVIYCFVPYFTGYVTFIVKDYMYIAGFVVWNILFIDLYRNEYRFDSSKNAVLWIIMASFMCLFRKNGTYMYVVVTIIILAGLVKKYIKTKEKGVFLVTLIVIAPLLITDVTEKIIIEKYDVVQDSPKEAFSLPFQQTARVVRDYGSEIPQDEIDVINKVLYYDELAETYDPICSNDVKSMYHAHSTQELVDYLIVWFKQFWRYPLCYIEATWNQNYYVFMPNMTNIVYNLNMHQGAAIFDDNIEFVEFIGFEMPEWVVRVSITAVSFYSLLNRLPIIGVFGNVAFYIILMIVIMLFIKRDVNKREWLAFVPALLAFAFVILAPQIIEQPRYAFPIIYIMPTLVAYYIACFNNSYKKDNKNGK